MLPHILPRLDFVLFVLQTKSWQAYLHNSPKAVLANDKYRVFMSCWACDLLFCINFKLQTCRQFTLTTLILLISWTCLFRMSFFASVLEDTCLTASLV